MATLGTIYNNHVSPCQLHCVYVKHQSFKITNNENTRNHFKFSCHLNNTSFTMLLMLPRRKWQKMVKLPISAPMYVADKTDNRSRGFDHLTSSLAYRRKCIETETNCTWKFDRKCQVHDNRDWICGSKNKYWPPYTQLHIVDRENSRPVDYKKESDTTKLPSTPLLD